MLFYDKILSGNRNIACGTCHHPTLGTSDGLSLGLGEGGVGLGPERRPGEGREGIERRVPRNAPALWNLGAYEVKVLMHDGRIAVDDLYGTGFNTPAEEWLPLGLDSVVAAQALFPMISHTEMAGDPEENEIAGRVNDRIDYGWPLIAERVQANETYGALFVDAFDHLQRPGDITIVEIANAIGAFVTSEFRSTDAPYDAYLAGDTDALSAPQRRGFELFYGRAQCSTCHAGPLLSDRGFRALGLPAFGPGRTRRFDPMVRDTGRMGESDRLEDAYRFRTPSLRNVALTAPYGHNGAWPTLEAMIRQHLDPEAARAAWTPQTAALVPVPHLAAVDFVVQTDRYEMARQAAVRDIYLPELSSIEISDLISFLHALTGEAAAAQRSAIPKIVPSGLPVDGAPE